MSFNNISFQKLIPAALAYISFLIITIVGSICLTSYLEKILAH